MPINPERLPDEAPSPIEKKIPQGFGRLDTKEHLAQIQRAKEMMLRALDQVVDPDEPAITIEDLRAKLDQELPGVSLSELIMNERELGY